MLQLILKTHLAFLLIPLLTLAIEPNNPRALCDRFLNDGDKASCIQKVDHDKSDWYASSACGLQEEDKNFLTCLDEIKGATYNPEALELCAHSHEISDSERLSCLQKIKNADYSRAEIKKCGEGTTHTQVTECLTKSAPQRIPASKSAPKTPVHPGFQSLEIKR